LTKTQSPRVDKPHLASIASTHPAVAGPGSARECVAQVVRDAGPQGPVGPQGPAGNPLSITWQSPLNYNSTNNTALIELSAYPLKTNVDTSLNTINNTLSNSAGVANGNHRKFAKDALNGNDVQDRFLVVKLINYQRADRFQPSCTEEHKIMSISAITCISVITCISTIMAITCISVIMAKTIIICIICIIATMYIITIIRIIVCFQG
jgi:hypothetical protein